MYEYRRARVGAYWVFAARVKAGDTHRRVFAGAPGGFVSSLHQHTVNIYAKGLFALTCGDVELMRFRPGTSTISEPVVYPSGHEVLETALADGLRICVEPAPVVQWARQIAGPGVVQLKQGDLLVSLSADPVGVGVVDADGAVDLPSRCLIGRIDHA